MKAFAKCISTCRKPVENLWKPIETPWKPPTYDECVLLGQKAKQAFDNISKKLEELDTPDEESTSED